MAPWDGCLTLLALCGLCLFFSDFFDLRLSLLPLPVLAGSAVWLCLWGFGGLLLPGAWVWFCLGLAGGAFALRRAGISKSLKRLAEPGFLLFLGGALVFWVLFALTQPQFILWDESTFWGSACKLTKTTHLLHPAAGGNLAARGGMPGLALIAYLFQFASPGFAEWKCFAAYDILYLAAFAALTAVVEPGDQQQTLRWPRVVLLMLGAGLLPYFFTVADTAQSTTIYLNVMGDTALGLVFGGALCLWFLAGDTRPGQVAFGSVVCLLTLTKEVGLAYAFIAIALAAADFWLAAPKPGLKSLSGAVNRAFGLALAPAALMLGWNRYVAFAAGIDKNSVGSAVTGNNVSYGGMLADGLLQLLGRGSEKYAQKFSAVRSGMAQAFFHTPVSLVGSGAVVLCVIGVVLLAAFLLAPKGSQRRRVGFFALFSTIGYGAFVVFHLFLYVYNFAEAEALVLKDYSRYIGPFYMGWLLAALCLLAQAAAPRLDHKAQRLTRLCLVGAVAGIAVCVGLWGLPSAGFWNYPHQSYSIREDVARRAAAVNTALKPEDTVFLISQGDDGTRWYYYGYELAARMGTSFAGEKYSEAGSGHWETSFSNLICPYTDEYSQKKYQFQRVYQYTAQCDDRDLEIFLREKQYTHLLLDQSDLWIHYGMEQLFEGSVPQFRTQDAYLYEIDYTGPRVRFVPVGEVRYEPSES